MPYKEPRINKLYHTMKEVTDLFGVNASQIRFYEKEFDILQPKKNKKGNRLFSSEDIQNLKVIFNLIKEKGFTLQGAKDFLKNNRNEVSETQKMIESLTELREFLIEIKNQI